MGSERDVGPAAIEILPVDPAQPDAQFCLSEYYAELDRRFDDGFDVTLAQRTDLDDMRPPAGLFLLARRGGTPLGCGVIKLHGPDPAELKRIWIAPAARGLGLGRRMLAELEHHAGALGAGVVRLDTNRALTEAIALYRARGYVEIPAFNDEIYAHHWFEKRLR